MDLLLYFSLCRDDIIDADRRIILPVTLFPAIPLSAFILKNKDLFASVLLDNARFHGRLFNHRPTDGQVLTVGYQQHSVKRNRVTHVPGDFFHAQHIAFLNPVLFSTGCNYRIHDCFLPEKSKTFNKL
jgi:hypothetical protein